MGKGNPMKEIEEELKKRNGRPSEAIKAHKEHQAQARKFIDESEASFIIVKVTPEGTETMIAISDTERQVVSLAQCTAKAAKEVLATVLDHDNHIHGNNKDKED